MARQEKEPGPWDGVERRERHWHLKKEITIGQIVTLITMLTGGITYVIANERSHERHALRIDELQRLTAKLEQSDRDNDAKLNNAVARNEAATLRVEQKLDRLIESLGRR